jgi:post-segregation antitoxin (ccd killing protein)
MTQVSVKLTLPDELEKEARKAGLLSSEFLQRAIESELKQRRRTEAVDQIEEDVKRLHAAGDQPMSQEELNAEIKATRVGRRGGNANRH